MTEWVGFVLKVYGSLFVAFLLLIAAIRVRISRASDDESFKATLGIWGITLDIPVGQIFSRRWLVRAGFVTLATFFLILGISTDISKYFPRNLKMNVYFDMVGIENLLSDLSEEEEKALSIAANWKDHVAEYDQLASQHLNALWSGLSSNTTPRVKAGIRESIHAFGSTTFDVARISPIRYRIVGASGQLNHKVQPVGEAEMHFQTEFSLRETSNNFIDATLAKVISGHLITPEFNQVFYVGPLFNISINVDHVVVGATRIKVFPVPKFGNTLYLIRLPSNELVPIAYGIYF